MGSRETKIGIDFDGVICDTNVYKVWRARELGICDNLSPDVANRTSCERRFGRDVYRAISEGAYALESTLNSPPVRGAIDGIRRLQGIAAIHVLTARTGKWLLPCERWLSKCAIDHLVTEIVSCTEGNQKLAEAKRRGLSALLDDDERHLLSGEYPSVRRFLFRHERTHKSDDVQEVNWEEFVMAMSILVASCGQCG